MSTIREKAEAGKTVHTDARGRVSLGVVAASKDYTMHYGDAGEIILVPLATVPDREAWFWKNQEYAQSAHRGLEDAAAGRVREISVAQYANIEID